MKTIAVVPAHNEEETVARVVESARKHVDVVLVVDDGSRDQTSKRALAAGAAVLALHPNRGKGEALAAGIDEAVRLGAEAVVTLDADGEHDPEAIPLFREALEHADVVLGWREVYRSGARRRLNRLSLFWFQLLDPAVRDTICGYRAFRASALPVIANNAGGFSYEHEVILRAVQGKLRLASVPIATLPRVRTHVTTRDLVLANNHFDRWVLANAAALPIPIWRRALLLSGAAGGLVLGTALGVAIGAKR